MDHEVPNVFARPRTPDLSVSINNFDLLEHRSKQKAETSNFCVPVPIDQKPEAAEGWATLTGTMNARMKAW